MSSATVPTPQFVDDACAKFDIDNELAEGALEELFRQYAENKDSKQVLLKVIAVNTLYRTNIFVVEEVTSHIFRNVPGLDNALRSGDAEIVEKISKIRVGTSGKEINFFSFSSKFCSWHNLESFPIYDARVENCLWTLQRQRRFSDLLNHRSDLWSYPRFRLIVSDLRNTFDLETYTFKKIDKFMYTYGGLNTPTELSGLEQELPSPE